MDQATQNRSTPAATDRRRMDFASQKSQVQPAQKIAQSTNTKTPEAPRIRPAAVTSAKDALNALYAEQKRKSEPAQHSNTTHFMTAREAVNAAAHQNAPHVDKSAAGLHRGKIQKNMESTRLSASALIKVASSPQPSTRQVQAAESFDPLAKVKNTATVRPTQPKQEAPVVRTSLKLGEAARPRRPPVILPPNARMARVARPVANEADTIRSAKNKTLLKHGLNDVQIIQPNSINSGNRPKAISEVIDTDEVTVQYGNSPTKPKTQDTDDTSVQVIRVQDSSSSQASQKARGRSSGQESLGYSNSQRLQSNRNSRAKRFRSAPKNFIANRPNPIGVDKSYVMTAPPKLNFAHTGTLEQELAELGIRDAFRADRALPQGSEQTEQSYIAPAPREAQSMRSHKRPDNNRYALGGESPFLKTVNIEKRPLSDTPVSPRTPIERPKIEPKRASRGKSKSARKNVYDQDKKSDKSKQRKQPVQPVMIIPNSRRSKAPLFFLVLLTIILGAAVGAAVYLCLFQ